MRSLVLFYINSSVLFSCLLLKKWLDESSFCRDIFEFLDLFLFFIFYYLFFFQFLFYFSFHSSTPFKSTLDSLADRVFFGGFKSSVTPFFFPFVVRTWSGHSQDMASVSLDYVCVEYVRVKIFILLRRMVAIEI